MGGCLSSSVDKSANCAYVVSIKGELMQYPTPIFVSEVVLQPSSSFLCNSDSLYCDHRIPALDPEYQLDAGQIYFILQKTMLNRRLNVSDMAALALKASLALDSYHHLNMKKKKNNAARISPLEYSSLTNDGLRSVPCIRRRKARVTAGSGGARLSTIYENDELQSMK